MNETRAILRHMVATVAYRGGKAMRDVPEHFATFDAGQSIRTPVALVAHIGDLFDWALTLAKGAGEWHDATPQSWDLEVQRCFVSISRFDAHLASTEPVQCPIERLLQGPVADALTHVGQLMLLRRLAGSKVRSENYFKADVEAGKLHP